MSTVSLAPSRNLQRVAHAQPVGCTALSMRHVYLIRRVSLAAGAIVAAIMVTTLLSTRFADATEPDGSHAVAGSFVVVQPGDTLWSLARETQPNGDIRPLVAQLARAHGGSALRAGDRIAVPRPVAEQASRAVSAIG